MVKLGVEKNGIGMSCNCLEIGNNGNTGNNGNSGNMEILVIVEILGIVEILEIMETMEIPNRHQFLKNNLFE